MENHSHNHFLDELLFFEILRRLPIKSLLISKCVCKQWNSIISSPQFASLHLKQSPYSDDQSLLINTKTSFLSFDIENFEVEVITETADDHHSNVSVVASCNGLICLNDEANDALFVWNPTTAKKTRIPYPQPLTKAHVVWGLGYVSSTEDYKLIRMYHENFKQKAQVFSFAGNAWKSFDVQCEKSGFGEFPPIIGSGVSVGDMIYWSTDYTEYDVAFYDHCFDILGFDLKRGKFIPISRVPEWSDRGVDHSPVLFTRERCLCACWRSNEGDVDIGMLRQEAAGKHSWVRLFHFDHNSFLNSRRLGFQNIQGVAKTGNYAVHVDGENIILLDPNHDPSKEVQVLKIPKTGNVISYAKSLLSPLDLVAAEAETGYR